MHPVKLGEAWKIGVVFRVGDKSLGFLLSTILLSRALLAQKYKGSGTASRLASTDSRYPLLHQQHRGLQFDTAFTSYWQNVYELPREQSCYRESRWHFAVKVVPKRGFAKNCTYVFAD